MKRSQSSICNCLNFILFTLILSVFTPLSIFGQISIQPTFPTVDDNITVTYDATKGNAALTGVSPVYIHTGLITPASTSTSDWKFTKYAWGVNMADNILTDLTGNQHSISYNIRNYYGVPMGQTVNQLAMIFRNTSGSQQGKGWFEDDFFWDVWDGTSYALKFTTPSVSRIKAAVGASVNVACATSLPSEDMKIRVNGQIIASAFTGTTLSATVPSVGPGYTTVSFRANNGGPTLEKTIQIFAAPTVTVENPPAGTVPGVKDNGDGSVTFALRAPNKAFAYIPASWNNWALDASSLMKRSVDGNLFWITIPNFSAGQTYLYQYNVDGVAVADPYSRTILDPQDDGGIPAATYPNKPAYPSGRTGYVTIYEHQKAPYNWQVTSHNRPFKASLVIYEMLTRDYTTKRSYQAIIDSFNHIKRLGVNAIQLMPVQEFENNDSWGYNPEFYMALDKYYGPADKLKELIDLAHQNGISVILDVTFNHISGTSPLCQMYWDAAANKPAADNPWVNRDSRHPFSPTPDLNHESTWTKEYVKAAFKYWLDEFRVDGFRLDLSKGFTQNNNCGGSQFNVDCWSAYDLSRVNILKDYNSYIQSQAPGLYVILEHLGGAAEEQELAANGMMLWHKMHDNYKQAAMAWSTNSNLDIASPKSTAYRSWDNYDRPVSYAVSHDEERMMVECYNNGNQISGYSTRTTATALQRMELLGAFLYTIPGAKMLWMFDELGYDYSINAFGGRTNAKPPIWHALNDANRLRLFKVTANIIKLRTQYPTVFSTSNHNPSDLAGGTWYHKHFHLSPTGGPVWITIVGNFDVVAQNLPAYFQHTGTWYDYLSGSDFNVFNTAQTLNLAPGEYHIFTNQRLPEPPEGYTGWGVTIPVELRTFTAELMGKNDVALSWQTVSERDNDYFAVERSFDGKNFSDIGRVKGRGASAQAVDYDFTDRNLPNGVAYYRLRQTDFSGQTEYSSIVSVKIQNGQSKVLVYPNPTSDKIYIQNAADTEGGILVDKMGRTVLKTPTAATEINIQHLPTGVYFLKLGGETFKVVKK
jgi:1,4-alpha-glucan branching enzyme